MASLGSSEGKDPTEFLIKAEEIRRQQQGISTSPKRRVFLGHDELRYVRQLRNEGQLDKTETLLLKAEPSPAFLDELRKVASTRARIAKKEGDWEAVIRHLEGYTT